MSLILGNDAAWGGWGWCLATSGGPVRVGHIKLGGRSWPMASLAAYLRDMEDVLVEGQILQGADPRPLRVVIEEPPICYSGGERRGVYPEGHPKAGEDIPAGNQAATGYGLGRIAGAIELWGCRPHLAYPWLIDPGAWRKWWKGRLRGKGRAAKKQAAVALVRSEGWGRFLAPWPWKGDDGGAVADVAEAILLAVGAARNDQDAPAGPASWLRVKHRPG